VCEYSEYYIDHENTVIVLIDLRWCEWLWY